MFLHHHYGRGSASTISSNNCDREQVCIRFTIAHRRYSQYRYRPSLHSKHRPIVLALSTSLQTCASIYGLVRPANPSRDSLSSSPVIGINAPRSTKTIADIHHGGSFIRVKHTIAR
ncbi:hypothetical protein PGTUg99_018712 [Puccinia graminis f. sp. tritici]|uniref:Uncharacterized protein n=1 Tax=Puccinia graminis f. sp. tritici TaxID=56615 RepID=A0A5B0S494_PUCGR|nr:hypothetical protein PGTUg99_018712 [Puccinia graminis f. sp. tritici]